MAAAAPGLAEARSPPVGAFTAEAPLSQADSPSVIRIPKAPAGASFTIFMIATAQLLYLNV